MTMNMSRYSCLSCKPQKGLALVTVLIVVAMVAVIATQISTEGYLSERTTYNISNTEQAYFYARGLEQYGITGLQLSLKEEGGNNKVHLAQQWATQKVAFPIEEDGELVGSLSGEIVDRNSCFDLNAITTMGPPPSSSTSGSTSGSTANNTSNTTTANTTTNSSSQTRAPDPNQPTVGQTIYQDMLALVTFPEDVEVSTSALAESLRDWIDEDTEPFGADGAEDTEYTGYAKPYRTANGPISSVNELLVIKGYTREVVDAIRPYVCTIPPTTGTQDNIVINVNTLKPENALILAALYDDMNLEMAQQILDDRPEDGYDESSYQSQIGSVANGATIKNGAKIDFVSRVFELRADVTYGRGRAKLNVLVRGEPGQEFKIIQRYFGEPI
ncbi:MAG: type II secretion system minor pseudopilin GspK [Pseudomonadota bacterium]